MKLRTNLFIAVLGILALCGPALAFSGAGSGTKADPYIITTVEQLQEMNDELDACYALGNNIDAAGTQTWNGGAGFEPVGTTPNSFTGIFDGKRHTITGLYINRPSDYGVGLFGVSNEAEIKNVGLIDVYVTALGNAGALVGYSTSSLISCVRASGNLTGTDSLQTPIGGLVGATSYANAIVSQCHCSVNVTAASSGSPANRAGGLAGLNNKGSVIIDCYSTGNVSGKMKIGGLVSDNTYGSYGGYIKRCYSTGKVIGSGGGLVGYNWQGGITYDSYWDTQTSGKSSSYGGSGKTTAQMMQQATFVNWDFVNVWDIIENQTYPFLRFEYGNLVGLEIAGPEEVAENFTASYKAIAYYDDDSTRDVTDSALWAVEPDTAANIDDYGVLTTEDIGTDTSATILASYTEGEVTVDADKAVHIFAICPTGTALSFDGVDDYVDCGNAFASVTGSDTKTIMAWARLNVSDQGGRVFTLYRRSDSYTAFSIRCSGEPLHWTGMYAKGSNSHDTIDSGVAIVADTWTHIALVQDGVDVNIYVNGLLANGVSDATIPSISNPTNASIGAYIHPTSSGGYFPGLIDDVRIYDRALSAEEIRANMHQRLAGDEPGLVGYWDFDEGAGQITYDLSGNGNDGRLGSTTNVDKSDPAWVFSDAPVGICTAVNVDIKPGSCPNPLNVKSRGVLPVAILGTEDFDVSTIDAGSIFLEGVPTIRTSYEDVATPVSDGNECDCTTEGPDGYTDLTLKFKTQEIVNALGDVNDGDVLVLTLRGYLFDGTAIQGQDCIVSVGNARRGPKGDLNVDGFVDLRDFAMLADDWLESGEPQ